MSHLVFNSTNNEQIDCKYPGIFYRWLFCTVEKLVSKVCSIFSASLSALLFPPYENEQKHLAVKKKQFDNKKLIRHL